MMVGCKEKKDYRYDIIYAELTEEVRLTGKVYSMEDFPDIDCIRFDYPFDKMGRLMVFSFAKEDKTYGKQVIKLLKARPDIKTAYFQLRDGSGGLD